MAKEKSKYPKISFVTPMKEKDFRVIALLKSIRSQNYPQNKIEIIIIDGGSNPEVLEECKNYKVKLFEEKSSVMGAEGAGRAKDQGIWKAKGKYIVIAESDIELMDKEWLNKMLKPLESKEGISFAVPGLFVNPEDNITNRYLSYVGVDPFAIYRSFEGQIQLNKKVEKIEKEGYSIIQLDKDKPFCMGSNGFMFRKDLIKKVGDYAQDVEFIGRLAKNNFNQFAYIEDAKIWHKNIKSLREFIKKRIKWTKDYPKKYAEEKKDFKWITNRYEFFFYVSKNLLVLPNIPISIKKSLEYKDKAWLLHAPLVWFSTFLNVLIALNSRKMLSQALSK